MRGFSCRAERCNGEGFLVLAALPAILLPAAPSEGFLCSECLACPYFCPPLQVRGFSVLVPCRAERCNGEGFLVLAALPAILLPVAPSEGFLPFGALRMPDSRPFKSEGFRSFTLEVSEKLPQG